MAENLTNRVATFLSGNINSSVTTITVAGYVGFPSANFRIRVENELMLVTNVSTFTWTVTRGIEGTTAASHSNGVKITAVLTAGSLIQYLTENYVHL